MATFTRLSSGSWRVQVRRKGKYVNETFLRRKDAEEWALDVERRVDRGDPALTGSSREARTFGNLIALHREDLKEVGKPIGRSKAASLNLLEKRLGRLRLPELDRARLIQFGKERAREGAGPVTLGIDLGYIKTILSHAAAVHGVTLSTEPVALARVALARLGLVGKGNERQATDSRRAGSFDRWVRGKSPSADSCRSDCPFCGRYGVAPGRDLPSRVERFQCMQEDAPHPRSQGPSEEEREQPAHSSA